MRLTIIEEFWVVVFLLICGVGTLDWRIKKIWHRIRCSLGFHDWTQLFDEVECVSCRKKREIMFKFRKRKGYRDSDVDAFIISFPKCGRTWLRFILSKIFESHYKVKIQDFFRLNQYAEIDKRIPLIIVTHGYQIENVNTKVIFLVREPKDVIVSLYFQLNRRDRTYQGGLSEFVREKIPILIRYYNTWAKRIKKANSLLVKYENIHRNTYAQIKSILDYLGISGVPDDIINSAIEYAKFDNMRRLEYKDQFHTEKFRPRDINDSESYKMRKGLVGGYVDYLSKDDIAYIDNEIEGNLVKIYGYTKAEMSLEKY